MPGTIRLSARAIVASSSAGTTYTPTRDSARPMHSVPAALRLSSKATPAHDRFAQIAARTDGVRVRVGDVAVHWGFAHVGRFAIWYAEAYGESPSATLGR